MRISRLQRLQKGKHTQRHGRDRDRQKRQARAETNEEVAAGFYSGIPIKSFPDILEELTRDKETLVVAGSYGKSTCAALLAWCLMHAGKNPSYFIGEITKGF